MTRARAGDDRGGVCEAHLRLEVRPTPYGRSLAYPGGNRELLLPCSPGRGARGWRSPVLSADLLPLSQRSLEDGIEAHATLLGARALELGGGTRLELSCC